MNLEIAWWKFIGGINFGASFVQLFRGDRVMSALLGIIGLLCVTLAYLTVVLEELRKR